MPAIKKLLLFVTTVILIISSPVFSIKEIEITGNSVVSNENILKSTGIQTGKNIFYFNHFNAKKSLLSIPYIGTAHITYKYPNKVMIDIKERKVQSYVLFEPTNSYLLVDEYGRVLDVLTYMPERLPVIVGLKILGFAVGEIINAENVEEFENVVILSQLLTKYELDNVVGVDVSDKNDIKLYVGNITVRFGQIEAADEKIRNLKQIVLTFDTSAKGTLNLSDINRDPIFKYLT